MRTRRSVVVIIGLVVVMTAIGCGPKHIRMAAIASEQLSTTLKEAQATLMDLHDRGRMLDNDYRVWQQHFLALGKTGKLVDAALLKSTPGLIEQIREMLAVIDGAIANDLVKIANETDRLTIRIALEGVRSVLLAISSVEPGAGG